MSGLWYCMESEYCTASSHEFGVGRSRHDGTRTVEVKRVGRLSSIIGPRVSGALLAMRLSARSRDDVDSHLQITAAVCWQLDTTFLPVQPVQEVQTTQRIGIDESVDGRFVTRAGSCANKV